MENNKSIKGGREIMRLYAIDILRGIAAFGIVGCHIMTDPRTASGEAVRHFCDMNVAVFAVLAGYFTYVHNEWGGVWPTIKHRLVRLLPLYFFWSLVFLAATFMFKTVAHDDMSQYRQTGFWLKVVFQGNASCHLWFIIALVYTQIAALFLMRWKLPVALPLILAITGIALSVALRNWYGTYFFRLFGFVWLGIALRTIANGTWRFYTVWTAVALVLHVLLAGILHRFLRDLLVVVPLVLLAVQVSKAFPSVPSWVLSLARTLGATSLGVYLIHPLVTRFNGCLIARLCPPPYGIPSVLLDWSLSWGCAFILAWACLRLPYLRRLVQ